MSRAPTRSAPPPPPPDDDEGGAPAHERLLAAAKTDNEGLYEESIGDVEDVNYADGLGNTALHYAQVPHSPTPTCIQNASTSVLDHLLSHESCDVDPRNRQHGDTPLHIAIKQKWEDHDGLRLYLVEQLLEAGASTSIRNRHNERPVDLLPPSHPSADPESDDEKIRAAIRRAEAEAALGDSDDVVDDDDLVDPNDVASDSD